MSFAVPGCATSCGLSSIDSVSTVWSTHSVHPSLPYNTELPSIDRHCPSSCRKSESANVNYQSSVLTTRNPWSTKLSGIQETIFNDVENINSSNHVGYQGEMISFHSCAAPGGICHAFQGARALTDLDTSFTTVRVTCATVGCNYGGPLHQACFHRWNSCCELKCLLSINTQRLSTVSTCVNDDQKHILSAARNENISGVTAMDELFSLYQCPRCGQCSLCRTSNEGHLFSVTEDPYASMLNAIHYVNQQLNANPSPRMILPQSTQPYTTAIQENSFIAYGHAPGSLNSTADSTSFQAALIQEGRQVGWQHGWKTCLPTMTRHCQKTSMLRHLSLGHGTNASSIPGLDSGLSSAAHSIDSSRRSSQNTDSSGDMRHHDDGSWSAPPGGPRAVRGVDHGVFKSGSKTDNYFSFDPLNSESPVLFVCGSTETNDFSDGKPVLSSPRHQNKQCVGIERITDECSTTTGSTGGSSTNRKHNSTSGGGTRGLSFWPSEKCRETPNDPSERRKVVNRKGNIFQPRMSFDVFENLPSYKRNPYFIHMDDDSCTGNEDTRAFLLAQLTNHRVSEVCCLICHQALVIYDHFPVIDGLFFISPICHRAGKASGLRISWNTNGIAPTFYQSNFVGANCDPEQLNGNEQAQKLLSSAKSVVPPPGCLGPRQQLSVSHLSDQAVTGAPTYRSHTHLPRQERYLHAVCMGCMHNSIANQHSSGTRAHCRNCNRPWSGSRLLVGGLYTYDIFAASLCCPKQLTCNTCESRLDVGEEHSQGSSGGAQLTTQASSSSLQKIEDSISQDLSSSAQNTAEIISTTGSFDNTTNLPFKVPLPFFSQYSQLITCLFCAKTDFHFVKPFEKRFRTQRAPSN